MGAREYFRRSSLPNQLISKGESRARGFCTPLSVLRDHRRGKQRSGRQRCALYLRSLRAFARSRPAPPLFASMNSTPAASKARFTPQCRAPQLMYLTSPTQPRTSDNRAFLLSLGHLDVVSLDRLELEHRVNALDRQTALLHAFLPLARDHATYRLCWPPTSTCAFTRSVICSVFYSSRRACSRRQSCRPSGFGRNRIRWDSVDFAHGRTFTSPGPHTGGYPFHAWRPSLLRIGRAI